MRRLAAILLVLSGGCEDAPQPIPGEAPLGTMTIAVGTDVRQVPFSRVKCEELDGITTVQVLGSHVLENGQPRILIARLRGKQVVSAHAFAPQQSFEGHDYDVVQLIADRVEGATQPECGIEGDAELTLICNNVTMMPWLGPWPRPTPSFKISFSCPP